MRLSPQELSWRATVIAACANPKISQKAFALFTKNAAPHSADAEQNT
jgi:hypothetical protein